MAFKMGIAVLALVVGYVIGAVTGCVTIDQFSSNVHDKATEAAMTAAFVTGPFGAFLGLVVGIAWLRSK